jgi:hypothetical protein
MSKHPTRPIDPLVAAHEAGRFVVDEGNACPEAKRHGNPHQARAPPEEKQAATLSDDLLWGGQAIADFLGLTIDQVYYLVRKNADPDTPENEKLPIAKLGRKTIVASRKKLQRALNDTLAA